MKLRPLSLLCLLLTACGQAGPLYLPGEEPPRHGHSLRPDTHKPSDERPVQKTRPDAQNKTDDTGAAPPGAAPDGSVPEGSATTQPPTQPSAATQLTPSSSEPPPPTPPTSP